MKSQLSAIKYIRNNKRTSFVLIIALALTLMAMYSVASILLTTAESIKPITFELPKRMISASVSYESLGVVPEDFTDVNEYGRTAKQKKAEFIEKLSADPDVERAFETQVLYASYNAVFGGVGYEFPLVPAEEIPGIMKHLGMKLTEGRLPDGDGELVIDSRIMKNGGMKVGDWFRLSSYGEVFRIVGVAESDGMGCVGTPRGQYNSGIEIIALCNEKSNDFRKLAAKYGVTIDEEHGDSVSDAPDYLELYEKDVKESVETVVTGIVTVVMVFLSISVVVAYISFLRNRVNEYCLYASIGYSRSEIYGMIMREMLLMFAAGTLLGTVLTLGVLWLMNLLIIVPKGLVGSWWMPDQALRIIAAYAAVIAVLQIPVLISIHNVKTIDLMED